MKHLRNAGRHLSGPFYTALSLGLVLLAWSLFTSGRVTGAHTLFPAPGQVAETITDIWAHGYLGASLGGSVAISLQRLLSGWILCLALGGVLGVAMHFNRVVCEAMQPWLAFYRPLPPLAYLSLLVLWLGVGETSKVVLLVLAGLPVVIIGTHTAMSAVKAERIQSGQSFGLDFPQMLRLVYLPSIGPSFLVNARVAFGACFAALIGAEMIASSSGVSWMIIAATNRGAIDVAVAGIAVMAAIALVFDYALRRVQTLLLPWAAHEQ